MLESFFLDNKIKPLIEKPIYHPANIDQAVEEEMGFYEYCKLFKQDDKQNRFNVDNCIFLFFDK